MSQNQFVSGGQDGMLSLWSTVKKKPLVKIRPHGGKWVCSLGAVPYSDVFASGSSDGYLRLWDSLNIKSFHLHANTFGNEATGNPFGGTNTPIREIPLPGFINSINFMTDKKNIILGVGQEHRFGRWERIPEARNGVHIIKFN